MASYPVSALSGFDDNGDGALDEDELKRHRIRLRAQVLNAVRLIVQGHLAPLEGLLLNLSHNHKRTLGASYLIVMGRFKAPPSSDPYHFKSALFSPSSPSALKLRVRHGAHVQDHVITHDHPAVKINLGG